ncbi:MAG: response regulator [Cyclobacteriaceae bacterium]|nr:response regulator [Cyclobacteriaceae bacterium]
MQNHFKQMDKFETVLFRNGDDALTSLQQTQPYLIILDHIFLNNPDKTGLEYLSAIRKKYAAVPVIYITVVDDPLVRTKTKN